MQKYLYKPININYRLNYFSAIHKIASFFHTIKLRWSGGKGINDFPIKASRKSPKNLAFNPYSISIIYLK